MTHEQYKKEVARIDAINAKIKMARIEIILKDYVVQILVDMVLGYGIWGILALIIKGFEWPYEPFKLVFLILMTPIVEIGEYHFAEKKYKKKKKISWMNMKNIFFSGMLSMFLTSLLGMSGIVKMTLVGLGMALKGELESTVPRINEEYGKPNYQHYPEPPKEE